MPHTPQPIPPAHISQNEAVSRQFLSARVLDTIHWLQTRFIKEQALRPVFRELLYRLLGLTNSGYGIVGELAPDNNGVPRFTSFVVAGAAWDEQTWQEQETASARGGLTIAEGTPFAEAIAARAAIRSKIAGDDGGSTAAEGAAASGWLPPGLDQLDSFLGIPFVSGDDAVGMLALANRPGGYDAHLQVMLEPLIVSCGAIIAARRADERRRTTERELAAAKERLQTQAAELARSNQELEQFAYVASHDLRQPLRMVSSYLGLIEGRLDGPLAEELGPYIGFARDGALRMDRLIVDLMEYSRIGRKRRPPEPVDLNIAVSEALLNLQVAIIEAEATVTAGPDLPTILGDWSELVRLFQNVVGNAVKYRAPDRAPAVAVTISPRGAEWLVEIRDNGIGIEAAHFDRIFGVFQRLHTRESYEGTGIGLAVCKKIVEQHEGRIWVESEPEKGTSFFFTLPANYR